MIIIILSILKIQMITYQQLLRVNLMMHTLSFTHYQMVFSEFKFTVKKMYKYLVHCFMVCVLIKNYWLHWFAKLQLMQIDTYVIILLVIQDLSLPGSFSTSFSFSVVFCILTFIRM